MQQGGGSTSEDPVSLLAAVRQTAKAANLCVRAFAEDDERGTHQATVRYFKQNEDSREQVTAFMSQLDDLIRAERGLQPLEVAAQFFDFTVPDLLSGETDVMDDLLARMNHKVAFIMSVWIVLKEDHTSRSDRDFRGRVDKFTLDINTLVMHVHTAVKMVRNRDQQGKAATSTMTFENPLVSFSLLDDNELTKHQKALRKMLNHMYMHQLARYSNKVYRKVLTADRKYFTYSWEPVATLRDYMYELARSENPDFWNLISSSVDGPAKLGTWLEHCDEKFLFPELRKRRDMWSYTNGVYLGKWEQREDGSWRDLFIPYTNQSAVAEHLDADVVSAKFIRHPYDDTEYEDWWDIPTPYLDGILRYQRFGGDPNLEHDRPDPDDVRYDPRKHSHDEFDEEEGSWNEFVDRQHAAYREVVEWVYAFIGRHIYALDELDCWQVVFLLRGTAYSGKSTIAKMISKLFEADDVFVISSNMESKFGLQGSIKALIAICYEVKMPWTLDQATFQSMASAEEVVAAVKNGDAVTFAWDKCMTWCTNDQVPYRDTCGNIGRRFVGLEFAWRVIMANVKMQKNLDAEQPAWIRKCNRAYLDKAHQFGDCNLWGTKFVNDSPFADDGATFEVEEDGSVAVDGAEVYRFTGEEVFLSDARPEAGAYSSAFEPYDRFGALRCTLTRTDGHTVEMIVKQREIQVLPKYFHDQRSKIESQSNPLLSFIDQPGVFEFWKDVRPKPAGGPTGNGFYVPEKEFRKEFFQWMHDNNIDSKGMMWKPEFYQYVFRDRDVEILRESLVWGEDPQRVRQAWIVGLRYHSAQ